ncbi:cytochrome P450 72A397 isoform X2 [Manihot esculenta]|uniref:Cytochrome P450 n=1 Tax=Manihot esculenta TaxID=3983 RepID=A0A2C9UA65_MANES|nr:cytochrome P450 72A397 isoform X2 [Manihot esculenta]OAY27063.1 hypothetical protein MANES_16G096600v8 [Manihot esculenta]
MDDLVLYFLGLCLPLLALYGVVRCSYSIWWKPRWIERKLRQQGIRGSPYKLLVGDMKEQTRLITEAWSKSINLNHQILQRVDPMTTVTVRKYGKMSIFWFGTTPRLIICDPELIKEVLANRLGHFEKPLVNPLLRLLARGVTDLQGEKWAERRKVINPAFQLEKLKGMIPVFAFSCNRMIEQWKEMVHDQETCEVDVWPELQKVTKDIISRVAFGSSYEEGKKIFELQQESIMLAVEATKSLYVPGFRFVPTKKNRRRYELAREITSMLRDLVERKQNAMRTGKSKLDDLLSLLLHSNEQNSSSNASGRKVNGLTIEEVIEECKVFYLAGQETTSSLLTWTLIVLAMHPDWQEKAREEVLQVCGKSEPNFEALNHLKIVTMILNEVLRLYPPVITQFRHAYKESKIGDMTIPAGIDLVLHTMLLHRDPELWGDDAEEFRPERFSEGVLKASKNHLSFIPFGVGQRTCIGQNFAMLEAKTVLARILQHFSFELSPTYSHAPSNFLMLQPQHGAQIILHQI